jgi:hypothetical protein
MSLAKMKDGVVYGFDDQGLLLSKRSAISEDGTALWDEHSRGSFTEWLRTYRPESEPVLVNGYWFYTRSIAKASEELLMRAPGELMSVKTNYLPLATVQPFHWAPPDWLGTEPPPVFRDLSLPESYQLIVVSTCKRWLREIKGGAQTGIRYLAQTERCGIDDKAKIERGDLTLKFLSQSSDFTVGNPGDFIFDPSPENL